MIANNLTKVILLPMYIEAMIVGKKSNAVYADIEPRYPTLSKAPNGEKLEPDFLSIKEGEKRGIHLHWILPEQYTHGEQIKEHGDLIYPMVPNRWFITRIAIVYEQGKPPINLRKTWMMESDYLSDDIEDPKNMTMIHYNDANTPYRFMGHTEEYRGIITSKQEHIKDFTAVTNGYPYFTAYYPQCRNVFGFYDSVKDIKLKSGEDYVDITYIVCGWKETPSQECMEITHGAINSLLWKGGEAVYENSVPFHKNRMHIAVGRTSNEAMAAMAGEYAEKQELEDMMHSLLLGELHMWNELDGQREALQKMHQDGFESIAANSEMELKLKERQRNTLQNELLKKVEQCYQNRQQEVEVAAGKQQAIYEYWRSLNSNKETRQQNEDATSTAIDQLIMELQNSTIRITDIDMQIEHYKAELQKTLQDGEELLELSGQQYWKPSEIVFLLEGADQNSIYKKIEKYQAMDDGKIGKAVGHRSGNEVITSISAQLSKRFKETTHTFTKDELHKWFARAKVPLPNIVEALIKEGILLSESCVRYMMIQYMNEQAITLEAASILDVCSLYFESIQIAVNEKLPNPMVNRRWVPSWNPLFMEWECTFYPDTKLSCEQYQTSNWTLNNLEFEYSDSSFPYQHAYVYKGRSILTPHVSDVMTERFKDFHEQEFPLLYDHLNAMKILSQCLSGLNDAMMGKNRKHIVLPWQDKNCALYAKVKHCIKDAAIFTKYKEDYPSFLIRSGVCKLDALHLIDTLGRRYTYDIGDIITPKHLQTKAGLSNAMFLLPPRFMHPTRLYTAWEWLPVSNTKDELSYVYGWLWANIAESCLHIYDGSGVYKGSFQIIYTALNHASYTISFQNPPGKCCKQKDIFADTNEELRCFVLDFEEACKQDPCVLFDILQMISKSMWNIHSGNMQKNSDIFAYLGHPLALAGMHIKLDAKQMNDVPSNQPTCNIMKTMINIRIGEYEKQKDGVIGFYQQKKKYLCSDIKTEKRYQQMNYKKLHACGNTGITNNYMDNARAISLALETSEYQLTLLVSPYGKITFTSGILPVKEIKLSEELVETALRNIYDFVLWTISYTYTRITTLYTERYGKGMGLYGISKTGRKS